MSVTSDKGEQSSNYTLTVEMSDEEVEQRESGKNVAIQTIAVSGGAMTASVGANFLAGVHNFQNAWTLLN